MKPPGRVLHRADCEVRDIPLRTAQELVRQHHYARGGANTGVFLHGLSLRGDDQPLGVAWWLPPTKPAALSVHENWRGVLSLTRLVIVPGMPTNAATFLLGASIRLIRRDPRWVALVTYADEGEGHTGAIYRASNWVYAGKVKGHPHWTNSEGRRVAPKATVNRTYAEMADLGYERHPASDKHKFTMALR